MTTSQRFTKICLQNITKRYFCYEIFFASKNVKFYFEVIYFFFDRAFSSFDISLMKSKGGRSQQVKNREDDDQQKKQKHESPSLFFFWKTIKNGSDV